MNIPEYEFEKMPSITKTNYRCIYYDSSENKYLVKMKFKNNCINDYFLTLREAILFHDAYKKNILGFSEYDKRLINPVKRKPNLVKNLKKKKRKRKRNTKNTKNKDIELNCPLETIKCCLLIKIISVIFV